MCEEAKNTSNYEEKSLSSKTNPQPKYMLELADKGNRKL
jgi:hypothetical protein